MKLKIELPIEKVLMKKILLSCILLVGIIFISGCIIEEKTNSESLTDSQINQTSKTPTPELDKNIGIEIDHEWVELGPYDNIEEVISVGNKLVFTAEKDSDSFIIYDGKEIGPYNSVSDLTNVSGKLAYYANENGKRFIFYGEQKVGSNYDNVRSPMDAGGKLAYKAKIEGEWFIIYDGIKLGPYDIEKDNSDMWTHEKIDIYKEPDSKSAYMVVTESFHSNTIIYNGKKIGGPYGELKKILDINEKSVFEAKYDKYDSNAYIIYYGKVFGPYIHLGKVINVGDKLAFKGSIVEEGHGKRRVVFYDGKEIGSYDHLRFSREYSGQSYYWEMVDSVSDLSDIGGKLAYTVTIKSPRRTFLIYDGEEIESDVTHISLQNVSGKLAYKYTDRKNKEKITVYDGEELGTQYGEVIFGTLLDINGKLFYKVEKDGKIFCIYDGKEIGKQYDRIDNPMVVDGKLVYEAKEYNDLFIVYDGNEIGPYDSIPKTLKVNSKLAYAVKKDGNWFFIYDRKETELPYYRGQELFVLDDKPVYYGEKDDKWTYIYDGDDIGRQYKYVNAPTTDDGKFVFTAENSKYHKYSNPDKFIIYDGKEMGPYCTIIHSDIDEKLIYKAEKGKRKWCIVYDGKEMGTYDDEPFIWYINGIVSYIGKKAQGNYIGYNGNEIGPYDSVPFKTVIDNRPVYKVERNDEMFIVMLK